jgi:transcriptional regulator
VHPNPAFRGDGDLLARVAEIGFATVFVAGDLPCMVHAPVTRHGERLRFHVARANRVSDRLDGTRVLANVTGPDSYISPNWYAAPLDQVPTWNYEAIEIEGSCTRLDEAALIEQLDVLALTHETLVNPRAPWSRSKMDPTLFTRMLGGICGFELAIDDLRSTCKLSQNKSAADRAGVIAGLRSAGKIDLANMMNAQPR